MAAPIPIIQQQEKVININPFIIIGGSLTLVVALAWNNAIQSAINYHYPSEGRDTVIAKIVYAFIVTFIIIVVAFLINKVYSGGKKVSKIIGEIKI